MYVQLFFQKKRKTMSKNKELQQGNIKGQYESYLFDQKLESRETVFEKKNAMELS